MMNVGTRIISKYSPKGEITAEGTRRDDDDLPLIRLIMTSKAFLARPILSFCVVLWPSDMYVPINGKVYSGPRAS
jgi:hypothetical protein